MLKKKLLGITLKKKDGLLKKGGIYAAPLKTLQTLMMRADQADKKRGWCPCLKREPD